MVHALSRRRRSVSRVTFSPDGQLFSVPWSDPSVGVWEVATGQQVLRFRGHQDNVKQVLFSHDGKRLLSRSADETILVWDLLQSPDAPPLMSKPPTAVELQKCWKLLGQPTAEGFCAGLMLLHWPEQATKLLDSHLRAEPKRDGKRIAVLVRQLDSDRSEQREQATQELSRLGVLAEPELRAALVKGVSAEVVKRARNLLEALGREPLPPRWLGPLRAVRLLEQINSTAARRILQRLAKGEPLAEPTRAAQAALKRLDRLAGLR